MRAAGRNGGAARSDMTGNALALRGTMALTVRSEHAHRHIAQ